MFAYCLNNPVIYIDPAGKRIVGAGIQGELESDGNSVGFEIVIYTDPTVCGDSEYLVVLYVYSGYELSFSQVEDIQALIDCACNALPTELLYGTFQQGAYDAYQIANLERILMYLSDEIGASLGVFLIDGSSSFKNASDYSGSFTTLSFSVGRKNISLTGFLALGDTCKAYGVKGTYTLASLDHKNFLKYIAVPLSFDGSISRSYYSDPIIIYEGGS